MNPSHNDNLLFVICQFYAAKLQKKGETSCIEKEISKKHFIVAWHSEFWSRADVNNFGERKKRKKCRLLKKKHYICTYEYQPG